MAHDILLADEAVMRRLQIRPAKVGLSGQICSAAYEKPVTQLLMNSCITDEQMAR